MKHVISLLVVGVLLMSVAVAPRQTTYAQSNCEALLPSANSDTWSAGAQGHIVGSTGVFPRNYYYYPSVAEVRQFVVEVLQIWTNPNYSPVFNILPIGGAPVDGAQVGTYTTTGVSLRIQTQFASYRIRVWACDPPAPTATPTPTAEPTVILVYPTATPGVVPTVNPFCGVPTAVAPLPTMDVAGGLINPGSIWPGFGPTPTSGPTPTPVVIQVPTVQADLCGNIQEFDAWDSYDEYTALVSTSSRPIVNTLTFVSRDCYTIIPQIAVPAIPAVTDGFTLTDGLQVCVNKYDWQMAYGDINISMIVLSILTFSSVWVIFALFRRG